MRQFEDATKQISEEDWEQIQLKVQYYYILDKGQYPNQDWVIKKNSRNLRIKVLAWFASGFVLT